MPLFSALRRQKQATLYEFEASLNYRDSSRTARVTQRNLLSRKKKSNRSSKIKWSKLQDNSRVRLLGEGAENGEMSSNYTKIHFLGGS